MAFVVKDRVKQTSTTTGTTTMVLSGSASVGYQSFSDALSDGDTTVYAITDANGNWETGLGTWESSNDTLTRTTVYESSNSNNAVNFSSGTKNVFITSPASRSAIADQNGKTTFVDNIEVTGINVEDNTDPRISLRNTTANASTVVQIQGDASGTMWLLADGMNQANNSRIVMAVDGLEKFRINGGGSGNGAWGLGGQNYGTSGQVITSNGSTSAPTWQTPTVDLSAYSTTSQIASTYSTTSSIASTYAPLLSPNLTGNPTVPTQSANNNSTRIASTEYVDGAVSDLVSSAPATLNTLNELASALDDDPNFATTITTSIGTKLATADFTTTANSWISGKDTDALSEGSTNLYFTNARVTSAVTGSNLNMGSNDITTTGKILYSNYYATESALPSSSTYHGMGSHVHNYNSSGVGRWVFAHANAWHPVANLSEIANKSNWDTAYSWGNHASAGYLTSQTSHADVLVDGDFSSAGIMSTNGSGTYTVVTDNSSNWNTAFGWGNHASAGYLTGITGQSLYSLSNVYSSSSPSDGQVLTWDNSNSYWKPTTVSSGGATGDISFSASTISSSGTTVTINDILYVSGKVGLGNSNASSPECQLFIVGSDTGTISNSSNLFSIDHDAFIKLENESETSGVETGIILRSKQTLAGVWAIYGKHTGNYTSDLIFRGRTGNSANAERLRLGSAGQIGIGGANYGSAGQVLTSNGGVSAPSWQNASGGSSGVSVSDATALAFQLG